MQSVKEIKTLFDQSEKEQWNALFSQYNEDPRIGVQKLIKQYRKKLAAEEKELERLETMLKYEKEYGNSFHCICGIDEAGRGPFAGPVVAGAVVLPVGLKIEGLNDSKKVCPKRREELYEEITEKAVSVGIGMSSPGRIDQINILQATYEAMRHAVEDLCVVPDLLLNDAVTIPDLPIRQVGIVKGDAKSLSIAAASIMAKVTRDRIMVEYAEVFPEYGFERHKGYGSEEHRAALKKYGPCPIHRHTFIHNWIS